MGKTKNPIGVSDKVSDAILVIICLLVVVIVAYPLYYVLIASVSNPYDVYAGKTFLLPSEFTLKGYQAVFAEKTIYTGYLNSIKYTIIGTIFSVAMLYICAYPLAQKDLPGRKFLSIFSVPQFSMINKKWLDELGLEVPATLDELHTALVAFKENDMAAKVYGAAAGSTIPMSTGFDEWCWGQNIFYAGFGFTNWINDVCNDLVLKSDGKVDFICDNDEYRDALTYFSTWYNEGLMDAEMFSQDTTQLMAKCQQGYVGVSTWWYIEELMGDYAADYVFLPILTGPEGTAYEGNSNVTIRTGGATNSGNLSITSACESPANLLKFFDMWYNGETVMQLQYGPIDVFFTSQDENGVWNSITEAESQEKYGKGAGELKSYHEVAGPKLILSNYYAENFKMEDRAIERLTDLYDYWMPQVKDTTVFPMDCVYTAEELETIDEYKTDFQNMVAEQEGLWIKNGGPTDEEWEAYKENLAATCGMEELLQAYQDAYDRYVEAQ